MKTVHVLALILIAALAVAGCDSDSSTSPGDDLQGSGIGTLKLLLTDAPAEYDSVNVTFSEVSVHFDGESADDDTLDNEPADGDTLDSEAVQSADKTAGEWIVISNETRTFNLLELSNGATALLGEAELDAGHYTQLRLVIDSAEVVIGGEAFALTIPSGTLKFVNGFEVIEDMETEMVVDFDAARSVHMTGNGKYKLQPTIRVINGAVSGAIGGTVLNPLDAPVAYAIAGEDTVTSSYVKTDTGKFTLGFLDPGTYTVSIVDSLGLGYEAPSVSVTIGAKTDLGDITLE